MRTRLSDYDINKLRTAAKDLTDILYDIPEGNFDLSKDDDYDDKTAHPVFGHDLPWQRTETVNIDDGSQMDIRYGNPNNPFEGEIEPYLNEEISTNVIDDLEYYKVVYSQNDLMMVKAVLQNEMEILASQITEHDTGHLYTTISTLKHRIDEINKDLSDNLSDKIKDSLKVKNKVPSDWTPPYATYGQEGC